MDRELLDDLGVKPTGSPDARKEREQYLNRIAEQVKGDTVGRIKVRMTATHVVEGQGFQIPKGREFMIPEESFDAVNAKYGGKVERVTGDAPASMEERPKEMGQTRVMAPQVAVSKSEE